MNTATILLSRHRENCYNAANFLVTDLEKTTQPLIQCSFHQMPLKALIVNAKPVNNGDAALIYGLYSKLSKDYDVQIATSDYKLVKKIYPDLPWVEDVCDYSSVKKANALKQFLLLYHLIKNKTYRNADLIVGAPGGYINSYYGFSTKLLVYVFMKFMRKKTAIYAQSIGPLNSKYQRILKHYSRSIDIIMARDQFSYEHASPFISKRCQLQLSNDAAFLLPPIAAAPVGKKAAVSVRDWTHDKRSQDIYYDLIVAFTKKLIQQGYQVHFISTCQGIDGYTDDSQTAKAIVQRLPEECQKDIVVKEEFFDLHQLRKELSTYQVVIGTRLHMCILSMLSGVPALNISYEIKGKECYSYLKLDDFSIDYNHELNDALQKLDTFIEQTEQIESKLNSIIQKQKAAASHCYDEFIKQTTVTQPNEHMRI